MNIGGFVAIGILLSIIGLMKVAESVVTEMIEEKKNKNSFGHPMMKKSRFAYKVPRRRNETPHPCNDVERERMHAAIV